MMRLCPCEQDGTGDCRLGCPPRDAVWEGDDYEAAEADIAERQGDAIRDGDDD